MPAWYSSRGAQIGYSILIWGGEWGDTKEALGGNAEFGKKSSRSTNCIRERQRKYEERYK